MKAVSLAFAMRAADGDHNGASIGFDYIGAVPDGPDADDRTRAGGRRSS
jgi:hypothetical protein